jgi:hypothetical protein
MRTGSVGNRSAADMVKTLVEPKKTIISGIREKLLQAGFLEDVEYDSINIEPVLIYSKSERKVVFLKHKWDLVAIIPLRSAAFPDGVDPKSLSPELAQFQYDDEEANHWVRFSLPKNELHLFQTLDLL